MGYIMENSNEKILTALCNAFKVNKRRTDYALNILCDVATTLGVSYRIDTNDTSIVFNLPSHRIVIHDPCLFNMFEFDIQSN